MSLVPYAVVVLVGLAMSVHGLWIQREALGRAARPSGSGRGWRDRFTPLWHQRSWFEEEAAFLLLVKGHAIMDIGFTIVLVGLLARYVIGP